MAAKRGSTHRKVKLRPQNPFDLIRLLARSQSDPRKAIAELVQNSLDAGAKRIEVQWFNEKGHRAISIWDDGKGVFPELERDEALRRIAQTIGHSHKRDLTPVQRREEMVLGKYGIGLIGFWSVGQVLEMRSRIDGGRAHVLRLYEDKEQGEVFASRSRMLDEPDTFTEITVRQIHEVSLNKIRPPRLQAYLAGELRGQLLDRQATVRIRDRVARGRARKEYIVQPRPYLGKRIAELTELEIPGYESARIELYLVAAEENRRGIVSLGCGGTVVLDDIAEIDGSDQLRAPWCDGAFEGVVDFPDLHVSPASRRGFAHDEPVAAFLVALESLEVRLQDLVQAEVSRRAALRHESLAREIRKAFASVADALPEYDFFDVHAGAPAGTQDLGDLQQEPGERLGDQPPTPLDPDGEVLPPAFDEPQTADADSPTNAGGPQASSAAGTDDSGGKGPAGPPGNASPGDDNAPEAGQPADEANEAQQLFPAGPLAQLVVHPKRLRLKPLASRSLRVRMLDEDGRTCSGEVELGWSLVGPGELLGNGQKRVYSAADLAAGLEAEILIHARQGDTELHAKVPVEIEVPTPIERVQGIPNPHPVSDPGAQWRSRFVGDLWEFNDAHPDFQAVADVEARRLRYLIHLFAKEVVLRNFGNPGDAEVLERMVEVLTRLGSK